MLLLGKDISWFCLNKLRHCWNVVALVRCRIAKNPSVVLLGSLLLVVRWAVITLGCVVSCELRPVKGKEVSECTFYFLVTEKLVPCVGCI